MRQGYSYKLVLAILIFIFGALLNPKLLFAETVPGRFQQVAENDFLQLYLDYKTTEIAVVNKASDRIWYSNPENDRTKGQLSIEYYTPNDGTRTMNNYKDSVLYDQFEITKIEAGVRIDYLLGLSWGERDYLPIFISEERFNDLILSKIDNEKDRDFIRDSYVKFSMGHVPTDFQRVSLFQVDKEALFGSYAMIVESNLSGKARSDFIRYVLDQYRLERKDITSISQVNFELIQPFIDTPTMVISPTLWPWDFDNLIKIIKSTGYTPVDKQYDSETYNVDPPERPVELFNIPLEYLLEENGMVVRIPMKDVKYPKNVYTSENWGLRGVVWIVADDELLMEAFGRIEGDKVTFPLHAVNLLRFFGAPDSEKSGYMFVPDGSGALINLAADRQRKTDDMILQHYLYGRDLSNIGGIEDADSEQELQRFFQRQLLPVFGMSQGDSGFFAIIEEGDAVASIVAETRGQVNPIDTIYPKFRLIPVGTVELAKSSRGGGGSNINTYQQRLVASDIQVRYLFLEGEDANYSGMARIYQQYLANRYKIDKVTSKTGIPFYLELIGGIHSQKPIMGIPRRIIKPLTTHEQVKKIVDEIKDSGLENIVLRYKGWLEGGVEHVYPSKVFLENALGNRDSFLSLVSYLEAQGVDFYPDVSYTTVAKTRLNDGFQASSHAAYSLNKHTVKRELPSGTESYVLSTSKLRELMNSFLADYNKYGITGLSLSDLGSNINSDFQEKDEFLIDRQQSRNIIADVISEVSNEKSLMVDTANVYALIHADHILNVPTSNSGFIVTDQEIPFYQMVAHGYVSYAGQPINHAADMKLALLKVLETGASPYFSWGYQDSSVVKDTPFAYLLSTNYRTWLEAAIHFYNEANRILSPLQGQRIINHRQILTDVYETTYEEGTRIIVNYGSNPVNVEGSLIAAQGYLLLKDR